MSRHRRFGWLACWVVAFSLASIAGAAAQAESPAPDESPSPGPRPTKTASQADVTAARCQELVAVLAGKQENDALLADPKIAAVLARSFDLVACRAVAADSDEPCGLVGEQRDECRLLRGVFHELRANPEGRAYVFPDAKYEICRSDPKLAPVCDRLRDAARSGDPKACARTGRMETDCRAAVTLDASLCDKADDPHGCRKGIEFNRVFAPGLEALAASGPPREQALAKAALGDVEACTGFAEAAVGSCTGVLTSAASSPDAATSPAPARSPGAAKPKQ